MTPRQKKVRDYLAKHGTGTTRDLVRILKCPSRDALLTIGIMKHSGEIQPMAGPSHRRTNWVIGSEVYQ